MDDDAPIVVMISAGSDIQAGVIARALVENRLAACVQSHAITSTYSWQGQIETAPEILLIAKTRSGQFAAIEALVVSLHDYDVPEIVALPVSGIYGPYRDWLVAQTRQPGNDGPG